MSALPGVALRPHSCGGASLHNALLFGLWGTLALAQTRQDVAFIHESKEGCFHVGFRYTPTKAGSLTAHSLRHCQVKALEQGEGSVFNYYPFTGACDVAAASAQLVQDTSKTIVAGWGTCGHEGLTSGHAAACVALPLNGFPGTTANASNAAWPSGTQPASLECWPKAALSGEFLPCQEVKILQDTEDGWPGKCTDLTLQPTIITAERCSSTCSQNPLCASWQFTSQNACWQGVGYETCWSRENFVPVGAQRLQQGKVRVLMDLKGWEITGLQKAFDNTANGFFMSNSPEAIEACKKVCYSDILCQYWQFRDGQGCYVQSATNGPSYPLTRDQALRNTAAALATVAGEFIQHYCPDDATTSYLSPSLSSSLGCGMEAGVQFSPGLPLAPTTQASAEDCKAHCQTNSQCRYYTFSPKQQQCTLAGTNAKPSDSDDYQVISGIPECLSTPAPMAGSVGYFTPQGAKAVGASSVLLRDGNLGASGPSDDGMPGPDGMHAARIEAFLGKLEPPYMSLTASQRLVLSEACAAAVAKNIGVSASSVEASPVATRAKPFSRREERTAWRCRLSCPALPQGSIGCRRKFTRVSLHWIWRAR